MTHRLAPEIERHLAAGEPVVLVTVTRAQGSTPRDVGTRMAVTASAIFGTIGGGRLEWEAMQRARAMIADGGTSDTLELPLGPAVGQCCGGYVVLRLERADTATIAALAKAEARDWQEAPQIVVFGAGHVGKALVRALEPLPVRILWVDARRGEFPHRVGSDVEIEDSDPMDAVRRADQGAAVVVMTHRHALDFEISGAALRREDLSYVGLIGSRTKRRRFERWFSAHGDDAGALERLVCPIGGVGVSDKRPEVIAALVTAEMLQAVSRQRLLGDAPVREQQTKKAV